MGTTSELAALNKTGKGGADLSLPDRGTSTGLNGDTYGAGLGVDDTNSLGGIGGNAMSDATFETNTRDCK